MSEAIAGFMRDAATVKSTPIGEAVEQFIESRQHKSDSKNGKRAQLSSSYTTHVNSWLREFAGTFPGVAVCELTKQHLNLYMQEHTEVGTKNRNDRRAAVKMFLNWAVNNDYLSFGHRLFEADGMAREIVETAETDYYRPDEFRKFLKKAGTELRPVIAIAGLAGLRGEEIMRLEWSDVWRVPGHIEISSSKSKTRQRRLVEICPALAAWLVPCRKKVGKVFPRGLHVFQREFLNLRREVLKIPDRRNGLRHGFCTYHFALHANENLTAQQAGNSPQMIHGNYKGLAVKTDAEKWFNVMPAKSADTNALPPKKATAE
jgi:integrase